MKIEVKYLEDGGPFRSPCWAVTRNGLVAAYCFSSEVAESLRLILKLTS